MKRAMRWVSAAILWAAVGTIRAATVEYDLQAYIDGRDLLVIRGDTLQWHHLDFAAVGRWGGANHPTLISGWSNGVPTLTCLTWYPTWPEPPPAEIRYEASSSLFTGLTPALPQRDVNVTVEVLQARSIFTVSQYPAGTNNYTLVLDFNDNDAGNPTVGWAAWYHVHVTITPRVVAPRFTAVVPAAEGLWLTWEAVPGQAYQLLRSTNLPAASWTPLQTLTATNTSVTVLDPSPRGSRGFYRLLTE